MNSICFFVKRSRCYLRSIVLLLSLGLTIQLSGSQIHDSVEALMQQYEYQKAIDLINETDADRQLLELKATAFAQLNRHGEAIPVLDSLWKLDTTNVQNLLNLANCYQSTGNYKNAQIFYIKSLERNPENDYIRQQLADAFYYDEAYTNAIKYYLKVIEKDSTYYLAKQLARCYENLNNTDSAILFYQIVIEKNKGDYNSTYRLANLYKQILDYKTAIQVMDSFITYDSTRIKIFKFKGYLNFLDVNIPAAIESFEKCLALGDTSEFTHKYLGYSYYRTKNYLKAKDHLEMAFQTDSSNTDLCYTLGISCQLAFYYKDLAVRYLSRTVELVQPSVDLLSIVYQDLAVAKVNVEKYDEALDDYMKALYLNPNDTLLLFKIGNHYDQSLKDTLMALEYYEAFMKTRPEDETKLSKRNNQHIYNFVARRLEGIKEDLFWNGKKPEDSE